jgi:Carboxypeptidase regulatory-like domain/TonB dependent receptor
MKRLQELFVFILCCASFAVPSAVRAQVAGASLRGTITDPSGALVPEALVQLRGPGGEQRKTTDTSGQYTFPTLASGKYNVRVIAKGFTLGQKQALDVSGATVFDFQLTIEAESQVINVEDEANKTAVNTDPSSNGGALVLGQKELQALSDDPDELSQQLQAMAGPGAGPEGGQIYIDGFTGGNLPPKSSIREVRINSNPFSAEYDRTGFGRIEIFTRPGTNTLHGQVFFQYNDQYFNSRSPLYVQSSSLPPYKNLFFGGNLSGPIKKDKASFTLDFERRDITENAFILATDLNSSLFPQTVNQALLTPQTRTTISPRMDYAINANNTLVVRYQNVHIGLDNQGAGSFNLPSTAYNQSTTEQDVQATETAVLSPTLINEARFQYMRTTSAYSGAGDAPSISVLDAFTSGSATVGNSNNHTNKSELSNMTTLTHGTHTIKWGARLRQSFNNDVTVNNFNGTFTFLGGPGEAFDANGQPVPGTSVELTALQAYQLTLLLQQQGLSAAQIRAAGGGASFFSMGAGTPLTRVSQFDIGLYANDDWRIKPNLTLSYGLRYETQTNIGDFGDWSPRLGIAWGFDGRANKPAKTVLRAGFGVFYDRVPDTDTLNAIRYNGVTQESYLIPNPGFFPSVPSLSSLAGTVQPQTLQLLASDLRAPRTYQANIGVDRQINKYVRLSANYINSRGVHLLRQTDANAPLPGTDIYPYGDDTVRILTESVGFSRTSQFFINPTVNYKKLFMFGFYALSYGEDDNEGLPANPYNLRAEWGPSSFGDVRSRAVLGTGIPLPWKITATPFFNVSSGTPYNITTGLPDPDGDGNAVQRPALVDLSASACTGASLRFEPGFGCFNLNPTPGTHTIGRNAGRGPGVVNLSMRLSRTWGFGSFGESGTGDPNAPPPGMGGARNGPGPGGPGGPGGGGPPGGGPPGGPGGGGPPPGLFGSSSPKRYNLTLSIMAMNVLNHPNFASPNGDLSSPFFGQSLSLQGGFGPDGSPSTYDRKISLQLRLAF